MAAPAAVLLLAVLRALQLLVKETQVELKLAVIVGQAAVVVLVRLALTQPQTLAAMVV
jgi:hypothetical protein